MKYLVAMAIIVVSVGAGLLAWNRLDQKPDRVSATRNDQNRTVGPALLGVDTFVRNVDSYRETVQVQGVVSSVAPAQQLFSMIDTAEYERCGTVLCPSLVLPVHWGGAAPRAKETVKVTGKVEEMRGKLVLKAQSVETSGLLPNQSE